MTDTSHSGQFTGVQPSFLLYLGMASIALLKDLLDLVVIGSLPGVGTVVTLCFSFLIWMLMALFDRSGGKSNNKMVRNAILVCISFVEALGFGLNFLPIETLSIAALYALAKKAARKEEKRLALVGKTQTNAERVREYQLARARAALEESEVRAQAQSQETANDARYSTQNSRK